MAMNSMVMILMAMILAVMMMMMVVVERVLRLDETRRGRLGWSKWGEASEFVRALVLRTCTVSASRFGPLAGWAEAAESCWSPYAVLRVSRRIRDGRNPTWNTRKAAESAC